MNYIFCIFLLVFVCGTHAWALPNFPGAVGFGSETIGGRGGAICEVTTLNDSGAGSLRTCVTTSGPRIVVFRTSGTINLASNLVINQPFVTVAGQSAPSPGITLRGRELTITASNVVVRHLRVRLGDQGAENDTIEILGGNSNVLVDHVSASWGIDENASMSGTTTHDVTISNSIISEALLNSIHSQGPHSMGGNVNGPIDVSYIRNLFAHNNERNPLMANVVDGGAVFANNYVYNWGNRGTICNDTGSSKNLSVLGAQFKTGPDSALGSAIYIEASAGGEIYLNDIMRNGIIPADPWTIINGSATNRVDTPPITIPGFTPMPVSTLETYILANVGARPTDRDAVDTRIINDVINGTGSIIDSQDEVGGWPTLAVNTGPTDTDQDGMPNTFEQTMCLNPTDPADRNGDLDADGYTNVEEYLNSIFP